MYVQSNSVIKKSTGLSIFVRFNHKVLCSKVTIWDQNNLKTIFLKVVDINNNNNNSTSNNTSNNNNNSMSHILTSHL